MKATRTRCVLVVAIMAVVLPVASAQAGIWGGVARGFEALGYQINGQPNVLGNGWDINAGATYTGQKYNFGFAELTLGATSPATSNISLGYALRGIPTASFSWQVGTAAQPLSYSLRMPDFSTLSGTVLVDVSADVNVLGFYDTKIQISNRIDSSSTSAFADVQDMNWDLGPINLTGNIYADALAAITQPFFDATGTENPFAKFTRSGKLTQANRTIDELRARIQAGEILSDEEMASLVNATLLSAIISGDSSKGSLLSDLLAPTAKAINGDSSMPMMTMVPVPEPTTLLLLLGPAALLMRKRLH